MENRLHRWVHWIFLHGLFNDSDLIYFRLHHHKENKIPTTHIINANMDMDVNSVAL